MNCQVLPPSSERQTPLLVGSGAACCPPRPPPPPPPPPRWPGCTSDAVVIDTGAGPAARTDFDLRVDHVGFGPADVEADAADDRIVRQARCRSACVHVLPASVVFQMPLPGPPPLNPQGSAPPLVRRGEKRIRIGRIHHDIDEAGVVVDELRVHPGLPAVGGLVEAAFRDSGQTGVRLRPRIRCSDPWDERRSGAMLWVSFRPTYSNFLPPSVDL